MVFGSFRGATGMGYDRAGDKVEVGRISGGLQGGLRSCNEPPRPESHCSPALILCLQKDRW